MAWRNSSHPRRQPQRRGSSSFLHARPLVPVNGYTVDITAPPNGYIAHSLSPTITVVGVSSNASPVDIQVEWRTTMPYQTYQGSGWQPSPTMVNEILDAPSGNSVPIQPPAPLTYKQWFYRARAGDKEANLWSDWTPQQRYLEVQPTIGSITKYIDMNIGVANLVPGPVAYMDLNVGVVSPKELVLAITYSDINVGVRLDWILTAAYSDINVFTPTGAYKATNYTDLNVTSDRPDPYIWWIRPEQGKEGYLFNIYGHGFGQVQGLYDGLVYLGGLLCPVVRWVIVPQTPRVSTVRAQGTQGTSASTSSIPRVAINAATVTLAAGDYIEYDLYQESTNNYALPTALLSTSNQYLGNPTSLVNDTNGVPWATAPAAALNAWHHRRFDLPSAWAGRTLTDWSLGWYGVGGITQMASQVRSFVLRSSDGTPKLWVTGDDRATTPSLAYTSYTSSVLTSASYQREDDMIVHGQGLDPDVITVEHGWITVIVPQGAVSAMVKVVLEG